jgi:hypothetical protein
MPSDVDVTGDGVDELAVDELEALDGGWVESDSLASEKSLPGCPALGCSALSCPALNTFFGMLDTLD